MGSLAGAIASGICQLAKGAITRAANIKSSISETITNIGINHLAPGAVNTIVGYNIFEKYPDAITKALEFKTFKEMDLSKKTDLIVYYINMVHNEKFIKAEKLKIKTKFDKQDSPDKYRFKLAEFIKSFYTKYETDKDTLAYYKKNPDTKLNNIIAFILSLNLSGTNNYFSKFFIDRADVCITIGKIIDSLIEVEGMDNYFEQYMKNIINNGVNIIDIEFFLSLLTFFLLLEFDTNQSNNTVNAILKLKSLSGQGKDIIIDPKLDALIDSIKKVLPRFGESVDIYEIITSYISDDLLINLFRPESQYISICKAEFDNGKLTLSRLAAYLIKDFHNSIYGLYLFDIGVYDDICNQVLTRRNPTNNNVAGNAADNPAGNNSITTTQHTQHGGAVDPFTIVFSAAAFTYIVGKTNNLIGNVISGTCKRIIVPTVDAGITYIYKDKQITYGELIRNIKSTKSELTLGHYIDSDELIHLSLLLSTMKIHTNISIEDKKKLFGEPKEDDITLDMLLDNIPMSLDEGYKNRAGIRGFKTTIATALWGLFIYTTSLTKQTRIIDAYKNLKNTNAASTVKETLVPIINDISISLNIIPAGSGKLLRRLFTYLIVYSNMYTIGIDYFNKKKIRDSTTYTIEQIRNLSPADSKHFFTIAATDKENLKQCCKFVAEAISKPNTTKLNTIFELCYNGPAGSSEMHELLYNIIKYNAIDSELKLLLNDISMRKLLLTTPFGKKNLHDSIAHLLEEDNPATITIQQSLQSEPLHSNNNTLLPYPEATQSNRNTPKKENTSTARNIIFPIISTVLFHALSWPVYKEPTPVSLNVYEPGKNNETPATNQGAGVPATNRRNRESLNNTIFGIHSMDEIFELLQEMEPTESTFNKSFEGSIKEYLEGKTMNPAVIKDGLLYFMHRMFYYNLFISPKILESKLQYKIENSILISEEYKMIMEHLRSNKTYFDMEIDKSKIYFINLSEPRTKFSD